jgi:hypothetical protein
MNWQTDIPARFYIPAALMFAGAFALVLPRVPASPPPRDAVAASPGAVAPGNQEARAACQRWYGTFAAEKADLEATNRESQLRVSQGFSMEQAVITEMSLIHKMQSDLHRGATQCKQFVDLSAEVAQMDQKTRELEARCERFSFAGSWCYQ